MIIWEYKQVTSAYKGLYDDELAQLGFQSWELVSVVKIASGDKLLWVFKRPKS